MDDHRQDVPPAPMDRAGIAYADVKRPGNKEISLVEMWRILKSERARITAITALCAVISIIVSFLITPVYKAEILLLPVLDDRNGTATSVLSSQLGGLASLAGLNVGGGGAGKDEAIAILQSRVLIDLYVKENALLPVLFASDWDENAGQWKSRSRDDIPTLWDAYKLIEKRVRQVNVDKRTGLVTLTIEWKDPELAARWAQGLVNRANAYLRAKAVESAENNLAYLQEQGRQAASIELQQAIYRLMETEIKKSMLANASEEYAFKVVDPPVVPEEKESPKRLRITVIGALVGLFVSIAVVLGMAKDVAKAA